MSRLAIPGKVYFFHNTHNQRVRVTVAGQFIDNELHIGVARCSEKDQFTRKTGREIALERMVAKPYVKDISGKLDMPKHKFFIKACVISIVPYVITFKKLN